tara:strand:- start:4747 stop:4968 length:222 start_codon:yes stop_codon:yes gene_type:complete
VELSYLEPEEDADPEDLTQMLVDITAALEETVVERDLYKQMHQTEKAAKEAIASELEEALLEIHRLKFYLRNT